MSRSKAHEVQSTSPVIPNTVAGRAYWTLDSIPGQRYRADKPVCILTSKRTFSGAEEFAYDLKSLERATIVGETTAGGAHTVPGHRLDEHFMIGVPIARAINPVTHTNWEGVGVEPDIKVPAKDALTAAQKLIAENAMKNAMARMSHGVRSHYRMATVSSAPGGSRIPNLL
ncbi:MAG TPA: S41 family peptidase, partial [Gemmatimonadaceae bacterium]|nr:S41 family peptidase [Gemmatimonadaceae bacterium]